MQVVVRNNLGGKQLVIVRNDEMPITPIYTNVRESQLQEINLEVEINAKRIRKQIRRHNWRGAWEVTKTSNAVIPSMISKWMIMNLRRKCNP